MVNYLLWDIQMEMMILEIRREAWMSLRSEISNTVYRLLQLVTTIRSSKIPRWEQSMDMNQKSSFFSKRE